MLTCDFYKYIDIYNNNSHQYLPLQERVVPYNNILYRIDKIAIYIS